jgi:hypothetical protein
MSGWVCATAFHDVKSKTKTNTAATNVSSFPGEQTNASELWIGGSTLQI